MAVNIAGANGLPVYKQQEENLKIVVCIKQVPDSAARVVAEAGEVTWGDAPLVLNPWDEFAVEAALQQQEAAGGEVIAVSAGGESAREALKTALAMGCSQGILITNASLENSGSQAISISDPDLAQADSQVVARVLAAAVRKIGGVDLVFFGKQAIDDDMGVTAAQTARVLGWPVLSLVSVIKPVSSGVLQVERSVEEGRQVVEARLPVVISVSKDIGEPRYPSFMGIRKASKAVIPVWSLADLGVSDLKAVVHRRQVANPVQREVASEIIQGDTLQEKAETLVEKILQQKVL